MSHARVKAAGWAVGEKLTSTQMNSLDTNVSNCIDKRSPGLEIASRQVTRVVSNHWVPLVPASWTLATGYIACTVNTAAEAFVDLQLPNGAVIDTIVVNIDGGAGHAANYPPANRAAFVLWQIAADGSATNNLGTGTDAAANAGAYEVHHDITLAAIAHTVVATANIYRVSFVNESGANALSGTELVSCKVTFTTTRLDEL